ncbi:cupin domain-containing protein [Eubacteriales bacterium mix99]|nr:pectin degradation protein [Clostridiales bacterium]
MYILNEEANLQEIDDKSYRKILGSNGSLMMVEVHFKEGGIGTSHNHIHEQISYVVKGQFCVTVDGEEKILNPGDGFYAGKNVLHGLIALKDSIIVDVFTPIREEFSCLH